MKMKKSLAQILCCLNFLMVCILVTTPVMAATTEASGGFNFGKAIIISIVIGFIIALIVNLIMRGQLKTVLHEDRAANYIVKNSMEITNSKDTFLYTNVISTPKPKPQDQDK